MEIATFTLPGVHRAEVDLIAFFYQHEFKRLGAAIAASTLLINALQGKLSKQSEGTTNGGDAKEKAVEKATVEAPRASRVLAGPILFTAGLLSYSIAHVLGEYFGAHPSHLKKLQRIGSGVIPLSIITRSMLKKKPEESLIEENLVEEISSDLVDPLEAAFDAQYAAEEARKEKEAADRQRRMDTEAKAAANKREAAAVRAASAAQEKLKQAEAMRNREAERKKLEEQAMVAAKQRELEAQEKEVERLSMEKAMREKQKEQERQLKKVEGSNPNSVNPNSNWRQLKEEEARLNAEHARMAAEEATPLSWPSSSP